MKPTKKEIAYENKCSALVAKFEKKQDLEFSWWAGDKVGTIACFNEQYYFDMDNIIFDLETMQAKGLITEWQDNCMNSDDSYEEFLMKLL